MLRWAARLLSRMVHHGLTGYASAGKRLHEPLHPRAHINRCGVSLNVAQTLRVVQFLVIGAARFQHLAGHAIHAHQRRAHLWVTRLHVLGERQVCQGPAQAAFSIFKRVYGFKPQVHQRSPCNAAERKALNKSAFPLGKHRLELAGGCRMFCHWRQIGW